MKETIKTILDAATAELNYDFSVYDCGDNCYELEAWSPAGEDVVITLRGATVSELAHDAEEAMDYFDAEQHAAEIYLHKHSGDADIERFYAAAPDSLQDLLEDAEAIKAMHKVICDALNAAA